MKNHHFIKNLPSGSIYSSIIGQNRSIPINNLVNWRKNQEKYEKILFLNYREAVHEKSYHGKNLTERVLYNNVKIIMKRNQKNITKTLIILSLLFALTTVFANTPDETLSRGINDIFNFENVKTDIKVFIEKEKEGECRLNAKLSPGIEEKIIALNRPVLEKSYLFTQYYIIDSDS